MICGNHHIPHRMSAHNTKCGSHHRSRLRSQRTPQRHGCYMVSRGRCHSLRARFGNRRSLGRFPESFQLGEQFTDAHSRCFVLTKLISGMASTVSKKLSLVPQKPPQFSAYLGRSCVGPRNIPFGFHLRYSMPLRNTCNPGIDHKKRVVSSRYRRGLQGIMLFYRVDKWKITKLFERHIDQQLRPFDVHYVAEGALATASEVQPNPIVANA